MYFICCFARTCSDFPAVSMFRGQLLEQRIFFLSSGRKSTKNRVRDNNSSLWEAPTQPVLTGTHLHRNAMYCKDKENELLCCSRRGSIPRHKEQCECVCIAASAVPLLWLQQRFSTFISCVPSLRDTVRTSALTLRLKSSWWHLRWLSLAALCPYLSFLCLSPTEAFLEEFQPRCCCRSSWLYVKPHSAFYRLPLWQLLLSHRGTSFEHRWVKNIKFFAVPTIYKFNKKSLQ